VLFWLTGVLFRLTGVLVGRRVNHGVATIAVKPDQAGADEKLEVTFKVPQLDIAQFGKRSPARITMPRIVVREATKSLEHSPSLAA
jgi:hypothetical protein